MTKGLLYWTELAEKYNEQTDGPRTDASLWAYTTGMLHQAHEVTSITFYVIEKESGWHLDARFGAQAIPKKATIVATAEPGSRKIYAGWTNLLTEDQQDAIIELAEWWFGNHRSKEIGQKNEH